MKKFEPKVAMFDVGGVLIQNYDVGEDVLATLEVDRKAFGTVWSDVIARHGRGETTQEQLVDQLAKTFDRPVTQDLHDSLWVGYAENLEIYSRVLQHAYFLGQKGMKLAVLSDTIPVHADVLRESGVFDPFETVILSYEIGYRKPDKRAIETAIEIVGESPEDIIFFDDKRANVISARNRGMAGVNVPDVEQLGTDLFRHYQSL